mgnify:CR=1 FL=1
MTHPPKKPRLAVHKFTSCDGCQLALLNAGELFLQLADLVDIVHFAEAGWLADHENQIDISIIEGSISTPDERVRIQKIRAQSRYLLTIGACATAGGIQALRNAGHYAAWMASVYATSQTIQALDTVTAIANHVTVDAELWGCPVNTHQVIDAIRALLSGAAPKIKRDAVCLECKRRGEVCVMVTRQEPCMGPVTQTGCDALCPSMHRGCYACYGPSENPNTIALGKKFQAWGDDLASIAQRYASINNQAPAFVEANQYFKGVPIVKK